MRERILDAIREVSERLYRGFELIFNEQRLYKLGVGHYRPVYEVDEDEEAVLLLIIDDRGGVYSESKT